MARLSPIRSLALAVPCLLLWCLTNEAAAIVVVDSPVHGEFVIGSPVSVAGHIDQPEDFSSLTVNGISVPVGPSFALDVPVDTANGLNRIVAKGTLIGGGTRTHAVLIVAGDGVNTGFVLDGDLSPDSVALRVGNTGLDQIAPIVESLSSGALDIGNLITDQNPIAQGSMSGINYIANVVEVGFGGFDLATMATTGGIDTDIQIDDFFLEVDLDLGWLGSCTLEVETSAANLGGSYDLSPLASAPEFVDVVLASAVSVTLAGFTSQFVSGICNDPLIGDIIGLIITQGDIQQLMQDGFEENLADPDGAGPLDSPLAGAIEQALAGISIAGPIGEALDVMMDAPIDSITEDADGLTVYADAAVYSTNPDPLAPDLPASFTAVETVPQFAALTPDQQLPFGIAMGISTSGLNQFLKAQIENGLLRSTISEFFGTPLTAGMLSFLVPGVGCLGIPPTRPMEFVIQPTVAPLVTGAMGPGGELTELRIGGLKVWMRGVGAPLPILAMHMDFDAGLDFNFTQEGLEFALATPAAQDFDIYFNLNVLCATEAQLINSFQALIPFMADELSNSIDTFPIPSLLGLDLAPIEVSRLGGGFLGLFADLTQEPTTTLQNVVQTDLSSGDFQQSGGCWLREWRYRVSSQVLGNYIAANLRGMLGADAGCTTNDASSAATASHELSFDVVSVPGDEWTLEIDHSIRGALNRISDGYNDGFGFQDGGGTATIGNVVATYSVVGGSSGNFDITPSATHISDGIGGSSSNEDVEFTGTNGVTLVGTGDASVVLTFTFALDAFSNSRIAFPTANGDEMAIRLGKNDTIDNNFTAGGYPGMGSRNIADDGHMVTVEMTSAPLP